MAWLLGEGGVARDGDGRRDMHSYSSQSHSCNSCAGDEMRSVVEIFEFFT